MLETLRAKKIPPPTVTSRNFSDENLLKFKNNISALHWGEVLSSEDAQAAYSSFLEQLTALYEIHFPLVTKKCNKNVHAYEK